MRLAAGWCCCSLRACGMSCYICGIMGWGWGVVREWTGKERGQAKQLQLQHGKAHVADWRRVASVQPHAVGMPEERVNHVGEWG